MPRTTSVRLNEHFAEFVDQQTASGRYASVDDVIEAGLILLEEREEDAGAGALDFGQGPAWTRETLAEAIREGEASGDPQPVDFRKLFAEVKAEAEAERAQRR